VNHSSSFQTTRASSIDSSHKPPNLQPFSPIPYGTNVFTPRHFGLVSKRGFGVPGGQIHYRLFEGDSVGFLMDKVRWVRITHRPKKIDIGAIADGIKISFLIS